MIYTVALLFGALVLLVLAAGGLDGRDLVLTAAGSSAAPKTDVLLEHPGAVFARDPFAKLLAADRRDVFATDHFNPPKPPPPKDPAPKPAKTRSVPLTYLGLLGGGSGEPTAYVRADKETLRLGPGGTVLEDWRIAEITLGSLLLTNSASATQRLDFRRSAPLEVPVR
jgi:hypothetical protein